MKVRLGLVLLAVAGLLVGCIPGAGGPVTGVGFDGSGRLALVSAANGQAGVVRMDALGNVVGIDRVAPGGLAVSSVVPRAGRPGDEPWVYGVGFGAGGESVVVGGVAAAVLEAVPGRLRVELGAGASAGHVSVTVDAGELDAGDRLLSAEGEVVLVDSVGERTATGRVHNLTVEGIHTYFVQAGDVSALVHNCGAAGRISERAARREAFRRHAVPTSLPNNYARVPVYGRNPNLRGPVGQPSEVVRTTDLAGRNVEITHHRWGHQFDDVSPPVTEGPHYHGPSGEHLFYSS